MLISASVSDSTISSYEELATSFDQVILKFFPTNVIGDLSNDNVVAIIIIAIAVAVAYVGISSEEGEEKVAAFKNPCRSTEEHYLSYSGICH